MAKLCFAECVQAEMEPEQLQMPRQAIQIWTHMLFDILAGIGSRSMTLTEPGD